jgi:hypothetical protein
VEACARARPSPSVAIERTAEQQPPAALEPDRTAALGGVAARALAAAESLFEARLGRAAAFARLEQLQPGQAPPFVGYSQAYRLRHLPTIRRLLRALDRLDRYAALGAGRQGAGLEMLAGLIEHHEGAPPRSLAYFLPALEETARRWKHQQAPRIKDRRIREGKRAPRRTPARPGRGPALGYDPKTTHFPRSRRAGDASVQDGSGQ